MHRSDCAHVKANLDYTMRQIHYTNSLLFKGKKKAKIGNQYNQAPHRARDTT